MTDSMQRRQEKPDPILGDVLGTVDALYI